MTNPQEALPVPVRAERPSWADEARVCGPVPQTPTACVLLLIPPRSSSAARSIEWRAVARFVLRWQLDYLTRAGMRVTLVTSACDEAHEWASVVAGVRGAETLKVINALEQFNPHEYARAAGPEAPLLLMAAPCVTDVSLPAALESHKRSGRESTLLRAAPHRGEPFLWIMQSARACALWDEVAALPGDGALDLAQLARVARVRPQVGGHARLLHVASAEELAALERVWARRDRFDDRDSHAMICALGETASIAPSAHLRGPILLGEGVTIGAGAHVGPWVALGERAVIGEGVWAEQTAIGARAELEPDACVYRSVIEPGAHVVSSVPVLKAQLDAGDTTPTLRHSLTTGRSNEITYVVLKRLMDVLVAASALIALMPILLAVMLLCLLMQGWPIFFFHERLGQGGVLFHVYKLRTMHRQAHFQVDVLNELRSSARFKLKSDPRVTRLGRILRKTSLDELPQIANVLRGNMSVVGPRPIVSSEAVRYGPYIGDFVRTLPGVTGKWQISGRSATTYQRRVMLDVQYGDTCSLRGDVSILLHSLPAVLFLRGAE